MSERTIENRKTHAPGGGGKRSIARWICASLGIVVFLVLFRYALEQRRLATIRMESGNRIEGVALACWLYACGHDGVYPALAPSDPVFSIDATHVCPALVVGDKLKRPLEEPYAAILVRPHDAYRRYALDSLVDDTRYVYLGYAVACEAEGLTLLGATRERATRGLPLTGDIPVPAGQGTRGGDAILRLRTPEALLSSSAIKDESVWESAATGIPIVFEMPGHYDRPGGWVVYLDRQSEFVPYPGPFPMTERFIEGLRLDRRSSE